MYVSLVFEGRKSASITFSKKGMILCTPNPVNVYDWSVIIVFVLAVWSCVVKTSHCIILRLFCNLF